MTTEEFEIRKAGAQILGKVHGLISRMIRPGVRTIELDASAFQFITDNGAVPSFKGYRLSGVPVPFPGSLCISVNDVVVHGFPGHYALRDGDIVSVDCGVFFKGFHSDSAYTYTVGQVAPVVLQLLQDTKHALSLGIAQCRAGNRTGDIGFAIQHYCERKGYSVVRELVGHGVGRNLHEKPDVPNFGERGRGARLTNGMVLAIEPMINLGRKDVMTDPDKWTIRTRDSKPSAHFEHTVAIAVDKPQILTTFDYISPQFSYLTQQLQAITEQA
jgi:methionyl aminopeptidase